jgi:hypothetical protein
MFIVDIGPFVICVLNIHACDYNHVMSLAFSGIMERSFVLELICKRSVNDGNPKRNEEYGSEHFLRDQGGGLVSFDRLGVGLFSHTGNFSILYR